MEQDNEHYIMNLIEIYNLEIQNYPTVLKNNSYLHKEKGKELRIIAIKEKEFIQYKKFIEKKCLRKANKIYNNYFKNT